MATGLQSTNFDWQNNYIAHLSADITSSATDVFLDTVPTVSEGILVIDPDTPANLEIIFYTSKTATKVICHAQGRGYDGSTAIAHLSGTKVIMAPVGDMFRYILTVATTTPQGWTPVVSAPNTVTANGNRSYTCVFNSTDLSSTLSAGMRLKFTRTVTAPTQCTSLNGTTQYYSKAAPNGMTFTDDFVVSAWVKLTSYPSTTGVIASRYNGTSGWVLQVLSTGQIQLIGYNAGVANFSQINTYQSVPLNKWVHVAAQLDMSAFTATTTTSYFMFDGVDVPSAVSRGGTNPTALVQAGNLEIGSANAASFFPGKIAQVAIYSAKVTEATILASIHQTLVGTETSLVSAYTFNNSTNDLNANANNLTANGSAVATNADSPYSVQASGTPIGTTDYGIIQSVSFSTNTTIVVQVPEGNTIPTSGGVSAVSYATVKAPYGMPVQRAKWRISYPWRTQNNIASNATFAAFTGMQFAFPIGEWDVGYNISIFTQVTTQIFWCLSSASQTGLAGAASDTTLQVDVTAPAATTMVTQNFVNAPFSHSSATTYTMYTLGATTSAGIAGTNAKCEFYAENAYL